MSYATYADAKGLIGEPRMLEASGPSQADDVTVQAFWASLLEAQSAIMDGYFSRGGIECPIDTSELLEEEEITEAKKERLDKQLIWANSILAYVETTAFSANMTNGLEKAYNRIIAWLEGIANGVVSLYGVGVASGESFYGLHVEDSVFTDDYIAALRAQV